MNTVRILIGKELNSYFNTWGIYIGYIIFFCICGFYSWFSDNNLFYLGQATMMPVFVIINWTQFFLIPALTMRSFAEEKRNGTLELMLSKPIKTAELIWGKFLSALIICAGALIMTLPYYITIAYLGEIDHGTVFLGYIGLICMAACYISIGLFASSLSRTPVTAFFIHTGIGICFQLLFGLTAKQLPNGFWASLFNYLSVEEHFNPLARGILDTRDIVFFVSVCLIFMSLSKVSICKSRY